MNTSACLDRNGMEAAASAVHSTTPLQRLMPAATLFFVSPLVAEFLLGNMSIANLGLLAFLAPLYGGGAILIREFVRKTGRGWPSILVLALAYGVLEEAFLMQTLFNPNFLGLNLHLLDAAYVPALGIGAWYTVFVLTLHTVWSISLPIALVESVFPKRAESPWLSRAGVAVLTAAFVLSCIAIGTSTIRRDPAHFVASQTQFTCAAAIILMLIGVAFSITKRVDGKTVRVVPGPWILGIGTFAFAISFLAVPRSWNWWAVLASMVLDTTAALLVLRWSLAADWRPIHKLAIGGGALMAYAIHAFVEVPSVGDAGVVTRIGNLVFALLAVVLLSVGVRRVEDAS